MTDDDGGGLKTRILADVICERSHGVCSKQFVTRYQLINSNKRSDTYRLR